MPRIPQEFADIPFAALREGEVHRTNYRLTSELVAEYRRLAGLPPGPGVPSVVFCTFLPVYRAMGGRMEQGSVHARNGVAHDGPARVGDELDVAVTVAAARERADGRRTVVLETAYTRAGQPVCTVSSTILWGFTAT